MGSRDDRWYYIKFYRSQVRGCLCSVTIFFGVGDVFRNVIRDMHTSYGIRDPPLVEAQNARLNGSCRRARVPSDWGHVEGRPAKKARYEPVDPCLDLSSSRVFGFVLHGPTEISSTSWNLVLSNCQLPFVAHALGSRESRSSLAVRGKKHDSEHVSYFQVLWFLFFFLLFKLMKNRYLVYDID